MLCHVSRTLLSKLICDQSYQAVCHRKVEIDEVILKDR